MYYALVTGASKGIGKAIAFELAARGYNLLLVARSGSLLENTSSEISAKYAVDIKTFPIDLSEKNAAATVWDWCTRQNFPVRVDRKSTRLNSSHGYISYAVF